MIPFSNDIELFIKIEKYDPHALEEVYSRYSTILFPLISRIISDRQIAEEINHHPDIIFSWGKLQIDITTHESGGITLRDQLFIEKLEKIFNQSEIFLSSANQLA